MIAPQFGTDLLFACLNVSSCLNCFWFRRPNGVERLILAFFRDLGLVDEVGEGRTGGEEVEAEGEGACETARRFCARGRCRCCCCCCCCALSDKPVDLPLRSLILTPFEEPGAPSATSRRLRWRRSDRRPFILLRPPRRYPRNNTCPQFASFVVSSLSLFAPSCGTCAGAKNGAKKAPSSNQTELQTW